MELFSNGAFTENGVRGSRGQEGNRGHKGERVGKGRRKKLDKIGIKVLPTDGFTSGNIKFTLNKVNVLNVLLT